MNNREEEFQKRLRATFAIEAEEHAQAMSSGLFELEKALPPETRAAQIEIVFRHAHSLKGAARAVNFPDIESICQSLESLFAGWKRGAADPSPGVFDTLHQALDLIRQGRVVVDGEPAAIDATTLRGLTDQVEALLTVTPASSLPDQSAPPLPATHLDPLRDVATAPAFPQTAHPATAAEPISPVSLPAAAPPAAPRAASSQSVRISTAKLDQLLLQAEEMLVVKLTMARRAVDLAGMQAALNQWKKECSKIQPIVAELNRKSASTAGSDDAMPRLVEFLNRNSGCLRLLETRLEALAKAAAQDQYGSGRLVDDLIADAKELLMLPFSTVLDIFPKLVRDLSREQGKEVDLVLNGGEVEIDKRILEAMKDALIHLVRNCVDHGIDKPEARTQQGKPARATLTLAITPVDGSKVEIKVSDDGGGIDLVKLKAAAVKNGVMSAGAAARLSEDQTLALIFQSGITTSPIITEISGRGLGMAIVREHAENLGGKIAVENRPGLGAIFRIVLPMMLATFRGSLVRLGDRLFVLPLTNVERVARIKTAEIKTVENRETVLLKGRAVSLVRLGRVLELPPKAAPERAPRYFSVVVLGAAAERIAFVVDEVMEDQEVLVKSLTKPLLRVRNIAGATILGSGRVVPILHVPDLMKSARRTGLGSGDHAVATNGANRVEQRIRILMAEDSFTSRMLLKNILESAGHEVTTAVDGVDALTELRLAEFDLIVSDVEMPRMNGFDLTARIRADPKLADKPVILVTALASREHRERGIDVGANAYIAKGSFDQSDLLAAIRRLA